MTTRPSLITLSHEQTIALEDWRQVDLARRAGVYADIYAGHETAAQNHLAVVLLEVLAARPEETAGLREHAVRSLLCNHGLRWAEAGCVARAHRVRRRKARRTTEQGT